LGLRRNIAIAMGNSGLARFLPWLERFAAPESNAGGVPPDPAQVAVQEASRWALRRISQIGKSERSQEPGIPFQTEQADLPQSALRGQDPR